MLRYGGVAFVFLLWSLLTVRSEGLFTVSWQVCVAAFVLGAVLINGAYFAAIRIDSEVSTVAAMASIPLLTFAVEGLINATQLSKSPIVFQPSLMWLGVLSATVGIVILQVLSNRPVST